MGWINVIALIIIVGGGLFLNLRELKKRWQDLKKKWQILKSRWNYGFKRRVESIRDWRKRLWSGIKKNPAIVLLAIAWGCILLSVWRFSPDLYKLYDILSKQILEEGQTADDYRGIAIRYFGIIAGTGAIIGYIFATGRNIILDNQNKINQQGQITESMVQAIAQIGAFNGEKPNVEVRLGGLYSLQRIMQDSQRDEEAIAKIFYAYVRQNAKEDESKEIEENNQTDENPPELREDVQAALDIINQFNKTWKAQGKKISFEAQIDLSRTNFVGYSLMGMDFSHATLEGANLSGANLGEFDFSAASLVGANLSHVNMSYAQLANTDFSYANLYCADLERAYLFHANFSNANLTSANLSATDLLYTGLMGANLTSADLTSADLSGANLSGANLSDAVLHRTNLDDVDLSDAHLSSAKGLTQEQINQTNGNKDMQLPEGLIHPEHWDDKIPY